MRPVGGAAGAHGGGGAGGGGTHAQKPRCPAAKGGLQGGAAGVLDLDGGGDVARGSPPAPPHCMEIIINAHRRRWGFRNRAHSLRWDFSTSVHRRAHHPRSLTCVCVCVCCAHRLRWDFSTSVHRHAHHPRSPTCVCVCVYCAHRQRWDLHPGGGGRVQRGRGVSQLEKPKTAVSRSPVGRAGGRSWRRRGGGSSTVPKTAMPNSPMRPVGGAAGAQGERGAGWGVSHSQKPRCPAAKGGSQGGAAGVLAGGGDVTRGSPPAPPHCAHRQRWGFHDSAHRLRWDFCKSGSQRADDSRSPTFVWMCVCVYCAHGVRWELGTCAPRQAARRTAMTQSRFIRAALGPPRRRRRRR